MRNSRLRRSGASGLAVVILGAAALGAASCGGSPPVVAGKPVATGSCKRAGSHEIPKRIATTGGSSERQGSAVVLAKKGDRTFAYVADADRNAVITYDVDKVMPVAATAVAGAPAQLLVLADGRVAVTLRDANKVVVLEPSGSEGSPMEERCGVQVPTEPIALAATPDDSTLLVTSGYAQKLTGLDVSNETGERLATKFSKGVPREPRAVITDDAGKRAFVAHVVGAKMSVVDLDTEDHEVRHVDLRTKSHFPRNSFDHRSGRFALHDKREGCQGFALAKSVELPKGPPGEKPLPPDQPKREPPKSKPAPKPALGPKPSDKPAPKPELDLPEQTKIFAPMVTVEPGDVAQRPSGYGAASFDPLGLEAPMVGVIDAAAERSLTSKILADGIQNVEECLLPRAAAVSPASGKLYVTCLGVDALLELDSKGTDPMRLERRRWTVPSGPLGLAIDGEKSRAIVWSQFDRALAVVDLTKDAEVKATAMRHFDGSFAAFAASPPRSAHFELGRELFHKTDDLRISKDGRACASCHPDGREDALTWPTPVGPRQTLMLAGRIEGTAPFSWAGQHKTVEEHLKATFQRLGGIGLHGTELHAVVEYVRKMEAPKIGVEAGKAELVARGKQVFEAGEGACSSCHIAGGTDGAMHQMAADNLDTPSLRFVAGTAPYFHDGRYSTLAELLVGSNGEMGHTQHLAKRDIQALTAYLESL